MGRRSIGQSKDGWQGAICGIHRTPEPNGAFGNVEYVGCYYIVEDGICDVMGWNPTTGAPVGDSPVPGPRAAALEFLSQSQHLVDDAALREKWSLAKTRCARN
jgi:hypothetical protein